jgi:tetratricopeptide (TPR) repeat protein
VVALSWIALAALAAACWRWRRTWGRHAILGLGFFALNLLPVIGLVTISYNHYSWVADHFAYLSIIGLVGLASAGAGAFAQGGPAGRGIAAGAAVLVAVLFAADSHRYARVFHSSDTLWRRALERDPASWAAHYNLGYADAQAGRLADGVSQYEAALRIRPDFAEAQNTLGIALAQEGRLPEAIAHLRAAVRLDAAYAEAHANLGLALAITGRLPEAVAEYGLALRLNPADTKARIKLGLALLQENRPAEAIPCFEEVLRLDPGAAGVPAYLDYARRQAGK